MKILKASLVAALLLFPSCAAMAATTTVVQGQGPAYYPAYQQYNPMAYGLPPSTVPGSMQQRIDGLTGAQNPNGQQQGDMQPAPVTYHYKGKDLGGAISKEELPKRLFHNVRPGSFDE